MTSDAQDRAEDLDQDKLGQSYPPEEPLGVEDYGVTQREEEIDEPIIEREWREEPDFGEEGSSPSPGRVDLADRADAPIIGEPAVVSEDELDIDDPSDRLGSARQTAEEAALHIEGA